MVRTLHAFDPVPSGLPLETELVVIESLRDQTRGPFSGPIWESGVFVSMAAQSIFTGSDCVCVRSPCDCAAYGNVPGKVVSPADFRRLAKKYRKRPIPYGNDAITVPRVSDGYWLDRNRDLKKGQTKEAPKKLPDTAPSQGQKQLLGAGLLGLVLFLMVR